MVTTNTRVGFSVYIDDPQAGKTLKELTAHAKALRNEIAQLKPGTEAYVAKMNELKGVNFHLAKINTELKSQGFTLANLANKLNQYQTAIMVGVAAVGGFYLSIKQLITGASELDDAMANVRKTTGLTMEQVRELSGEFKDMNTKSSRKELLDLAAVAGKLGIEGYQNILGFVRGADKIKVALAEDLGGNVEEAVNTIGKLVDIFKVKEKFGIEEAMNKVGSVINALGAASAASEANIVEFMKRLGGVAPNAKISIQEVAGLGATIDSLGVTSEVAGTAISQLILGMFKKTSEFAKLAGMDVKAFSDLLAVDANAALIKLLEGIKGNNSGMMDMAGHLNDLKLDGARTVSVVGVLANNIKMLKDQQALANTEFDKGTSLINEFNIKNETVGASLAKIGKVLHSYFVSGSLTSGLKEFFGWISRIMEVKLSEKLEEESVKVNMLASQLLTANLRAEDRNKLYKELESMHPKLVEGMTEEAINYDLLRKNLKEFNNELINRIILQENQEKLDDQNRKTAKALRKEKETEIEIEKDFQKEIKQARKAGYEDYANEIEKITQNEDYTLYRKMFEIEKASMNLRKIPSNLQFGVMATWLAHDNEEFDKQNTKTSELINERGELIRKLGIKETEEVKTKGPAEGDMQMMNGIAMIFKSGKWVTFESTLPPAKTHKEKTAKLSKEDELHPNRKDYEEWLKQNEDWQKIIDGQEQRNIERRDKYLIKQEQLEIDAAELASKNDTEFAKKRLEIQLKYLQARLDLVNQYKDSVNGPITEEDQQNIDALTIAVKKLKDQIFTLTGGKEGESANEKTLMESLGITKEDVTKATEYANQITDIIGKLVDVKNKQIENEIKKEDYAYEKEKQRIEKSNINQNEKNKQLEKLDKEHKQRQYETELKQWETVQDWAYTKAVIYAALATIKYIAEEDWVSAALAATAGAVEIAVIASEEPPEPPVFAAGGKTGKGTYKDYTGKRVAGVVHEEEYVIPEWERKIPVVANMERTIENIRTGRMQGYISGGAVTNNTNTYNSTDTELLQKVLYRMEHPVPVYLNLNQKDIIDFTRVQDNLNKNKQDGLIG